MITIIDNITGEIIHCPENKAEQICKTRVFNHNREFSYSHRGKHYSQHAIYYKLNDKYIIERKN